MKINPYSAQGINPYKRQINKQDFTNSKTGKTADKVEISSAAIEMQQGGSQVTAQRQAKVDELKSQVANGTYQVDPKAVANSIVKFYSNN